MSRNKKQHYIPAFYLYHFTSPEQQAASENRPRRETMIHYYDFDKDRILERPIKKVAIASYLYSYQESPISYNHSLDEEIQQVENKASIAIRELSVMVKDTLKHKPRTVCIEDSLIENIMDLLYWQIKRHPEMVEGFESECEQFCLKKRCPPEEAKRIALDSIRDLGQGGEFDLKTEFDKKNKVIICTEHPEATFITSDNPFVRFNKTNMNGIAVEGTEMYYPITSNILLFMCDNGTRKELVVEKSRPFLRKFNTLMAKSAKRYIFSKSDRLLKRILKNMKQ